MPTPDDFRKELRRQLDLAKAGGRREVVVNAGELHRVVGNYPDPKKHRMPECCRIMREEMKVGDEIVSQPPKGNGASVSIRYRIPR